MGKRKSKRGSTLVTVLAVAVVFMALSATIITSVMGTMKTNTNQKIREDLRYAAESGLEIARSYLEGKSTIIQEDIDKINDRLKYLLVDINGDSIPDGEIGSVKMISPIINGGNIENPPIKSNEASGNVSGFTVRIRAEKTGNSEINENVGVDYLKGKNNLSNDIFNNGLVSGVGGIGIDTSNSDGSTEEVKLDNTVIAVNPENDLNVNGVVKESTKKDYGELEFAPNIDFKKEIIMRKNIIGDVNLDMQFGMGGCSNAFKFLEIENGIEKNIQPTYLKIDLSNEIKLVKTNEVGIWIKDLDLNNIRTENLSSVIMIDIVGLNPFRYIFIITNTNKLNIEMLSGAVKLVRGAILNKGIINIGGTGTFHMNYSTMFGSEINIEADKNIAIDGVGTTNEHGMIVNRDKLDLILERLFLNWGNNGEESNGGQLKVNGNFTN